MQLLRIPLQAVVGLFLQFSAPARAQSPSPWWLSPHLPGRMPSRWRVEGDRGHIPSRSIQLLSQVQSHTDEYLHARLKDTLLRVLRGCILSPSHGSIRRQIPRRAQPMFVERFRLDLCGSSHSSHEGNFHKDKYPVLIVTPGLRESRVDFCVFGQYLSSYGYYKVNSPASQISPNFPMARSSEQFSVPTPRLRMRYSR